MAEEVIVAAQVRAGRALVECSQEDLAQKAEVGLSSLREIENQKRPADTEAAEKIARALRNLGVIFIPSSVTTGPGVCLADKRPHIIRAPTTMNFWDGMPFIVEWRGQRLIVFISRDALDDLGRIRERATDEVYRNIFEKFRAEILEAVVVAAGKPERFDDRGRVHVHSGDIAVLGYPN